MLKINADLDDIEWQWQFGTTVNDVPSALVVGDSAVYVVGTTSDFDGDLSECMYDALPVVWTNHIMQIFVFPFFFFPS